MTPLTPGRYQQFFLSILQSVLELPQIRTSAQAMDTLNLIFVPHSYINSTIHIYHFNRFVDSPPKTKKRRRKMYIYLLNIITQK